ncbi:hypothetical protein PUND_b0290 [Pseudoalteromonas undina]|nr:hypothetical protein PUND_b0290 [Pseudoalteromonas undina]
MRVECGYSKLRKHIHQYKTPFELKQLIFNSASAIVEVDL